MDTMTEHYPHDMYAAEARADERAAFLRRTYGHVFGAILAFAGIEAVIFSTPQLHRPILQMVGGNWWLALLAFMAVSWVAEKWAASGASTGVQYLGLALYTFAEAIIFIPLLTIASFVGGADLIMNAGILTLIIFGGLTTIVFLTGADFSFLRNVLFVGGLTLTGVAICGAIFGFHLGLLFTGLVIALMCGYILYDTSNIMYHYRTDQHVSAALALFASVATLFFHILRLLIQLQSNDD